MAYKTFLVPGTQCGSSEEADGRRLQRLQVVPATSSDAIRNGMHQSSGKLNHSGGDVLKGLSLTSGAKAEQTGVRDQAPEHGHLLSGQQVVWSA